jgi:lipopolysaccharide export system permease protein
LTAVVVLSDFIELLRRSASRPDATFAIVTQIGLMRIPWLAMQILPYAVLLGGILAFWRLTRSSELIVARAAGVSAWQFLVAPVACAIALGGIATAAVSPISAAMRARAEALDNVYPKSSGGPLALTGGQLWLRQADHTLDPLGVAILHALAVALKGNELTATSVSVFRLDGHDRLLERIGATQATLGPGAWVLASARTVTPGNCRTRRGGSVCPPT